MTVSHRQSNLLLALLLFVVGAISSPLWLLTGLPTVVCLVLAAIFWAMIWFYIATARNGADRYRVSPNKTWQLDVMPDDGCFRIPEKHFDRLRPLLSEDKGTSVKENLVKIVFRLHWIKLLKLVTLPALATAVALVAMFIAIARGGGFYFDWGSKAISPPGSAVLTPTTFGPFTVIPTTNRPTIPTVPPSLLEQPKFGIPWWILLIVVALLAFVTWAQSWKWKYFYVMVTNMRVVLVCAPPAYLLPFPWVKASAESLQMVSIEEAIEESGSLGTLLRYGKVGINAPTTGDQNFEGIFDVPNPVEVAVIINDEIARVRHQRNAHRE